MALRTEYKEISNSAGWTEIQLPSGDISFTIQNISEVMMEYTFTDTVKRGSFLTPYTLIIDNRQSVFVRFADAQQNGAISITRESL